MENNEFEKTDLVKYEKYYSEEGFWTKLSHFATKAGQKVAYVALILFYLLKSGNIPLTDKAYIIGALGYLILPIDLIPDSIPFFGFTDDFAALFFVFNHVKANITDDIKAQAKSKMRDWFDNVDDVELDDSIQN